MGWEVSIIAAFAVIQELPSLSGVALLTAFIREAIARQQIWTDHLKALRIPHRRASNLGRDADRRTHSQSQDLGNRHQRRAATECVAPVRPHSWINFRTHSTDDLPFLPRAFIFDVEGTLIDNVLATLQCWSETLAEIGYNASIADLHPFSGMEGKQMLRRLLNRHDPKLLDHIVMLQGERYRAHYLQSARPFSGLRRLFTAIRDSNAKIALATSCDKDELAHYRAIMNVDDLIDEACCGEDVRREKPSSEIVILAAKRARLPPAQIVMIGDTPYDAEAARRAEVTAIGLQSGHFSRADLIDAGCFSVFFDLQALNYKLVDQAAAIAPSSDHKLSQGAESC